MATKPRKSKAPKDVNAPKKNLSAYFIFTNKRRGELREQHPDKKLTQLTTLMAAEWKSMDPATKKAYQDQADADKENYNTSMAEYKKTENYAMYQAKLSGWKTEQKLTADKKAAKKPKDVNAPKKPPTAYFLFTANIRAEVTAANPDLKITQLAKVMGQKWKGLPEDEKKPFQDEAARLKQEHITTVANYRQSDLYKAYLSKVAEWENEQRMKAMKEKADKEREEKKMPKLKVSMPRKPKDANAPKKPLTAFLLFSGSVREQARAENPELKMTKIAGVIGQKWKALSEEEQKKWSEIAVKQKADYQTVLAEYKQSENYRTFQAKMAEWEQECQRRKKDAEAKLVKQMERMSTEAAKQKEMKNKKKMAKSKSHSKSQSKSVSSSKKRYYDSESDSDSYSSDSSSYSSSSGSYSSSSSSSGSYSKHKRSHGSYSHSSYSS